MAIQEQVELLQQGVDVWNQWRALHPRTAIDLSDANFIVTELSRADLHHATLSRANFSRTDLSYADLREAHLVNADLGATDLSYANLNFAHLEESNLRFAHLNEANFSRAFLHEANLREADLSRANLSEANFGRAHLNEADLSRANLSFADLREADLSRANLNGADLNGAIIGETQFADIDLCTVKGLETIYHMGPSYISTSTLERSQGNIPEAFLRGAGLSDTFIEYARSLVARPIEYYTCFLSYSRKDQAIAERLYADLQRSGVRCWYAPHELKPGDYYRHKIDESIRIYDKLVLILSEHSVESEWVEKEVEIALKKEESMDMTRQILFPLRLDNAALQSRRAWVRSLRFHRHIGDFTGWKDHDTYQAAFERLLSDLKAESVKKSE